MRRGRYESHFLRAVDPSAPRAVWIRHTLLERRGGPRDARWDLRVEPASEPLLHLPRPLYRAPLPRTKLTSPAPLAWIRGTVTVGAKRLELDGWPGMTGHNWGT